LTSLLFSMMPEAVFTSFTIRGYALVILFGLMASDALIQALKKCSIHQWLLFALWITLAGYTHIFSLLFLGPAFLFVAWWLGCNWRLLGPQTRRGYVSGLLVAFGVIGIGMLGIAGLLFQSRAGVELLRNALSYRWVGDFAPFQLSDLKATFSSYIEPLRMANFTEERDWHLLLYGAVVVLGAMVGLVRKRDRWATRFLVLVAVVPMVSVTVFHSVVGEWFFVMTHYLDFSLFCYIFLAAYGIHWLVHKLGRNRWIASLATVLIIGAIASPAYTSLANWHSIGEAQDMVKVAHYLQDHVSPDDLILCISRQSQGSDAEKDRCWNTLHFYPQLAERTFSLEWPEINNYRTWQSLLAPQHRCTSHYIALPRVRAGVTCGDGGGNGPGIWLVFWQPQATEVPYVWDSPRVAASFGTTRVVELAQSEVLRNNLDQAAELILSDVVSPERISRNALAMAHMYASMADTSRAQALLQSVGQIDTKDDLAGKAAALQELVPYLGGVALPETLSGATWGGQIRLYGYALQVQPSLQGIYDLTVTLFWQAVGRPEGDYTFFLHWRDPKNTNLAQIDFRPYDGLLPTTQWQAGEIIRETRRLQVPAPQLGKSYRLVVGVYDAGTMERLRLENDQSSENVLELGTGWSMP